MNAALNSVIYPLSFLFVLSLIVVIHEFGHFIAARLCGVDVEEFSFGFGRVLYQRSDKRGTAWKICALPLGGYVKMLGDSDPASAKPDEKVKEFTEEEKKRAFFFQNVWKKLFIIVAGPGMNYVLAIVLLTGFYSVYGVITVPPVISEVMRESAAEKAGLAVGDRIVRINGKEIVDFTQVRRVVQLDSVLDIVVDRAGKEVALQAKISHETGGAVLGITANAKAEDLKKVSFFKAFVQSLEDTWDLTVDTVVVLKRIVTRQRSTEDMRGPLGIAEASGDAFREGLESFLLFIVQVSVGIGFVNLLPIPILDGGHIMIYTIEAVIRRPLSQKMQTFALSVGMVFLLGLLVLTSWNDIVRIFQRLFG